MDASPKTLCPTSPLEKVGPNPPPPPQEMVAPPFQQANPGQCSICPQRQKPQHGEVRFEDTQPPAPQSQPCQVDNGWSTVRQHQLSPQRHHQATITDIWRSQQPPANKCHTGTPPVHVP